MDDDNSLTGCLALLVLYFVGIPLGLVWEGFVLTELWAWFVVPAFDVGVIGVTAATGLIVIFRHAMPGRYEHRKRPVSELYKRGFVVFGLQPVVTLLVGWILSLCL